MTRAMDTLILTRAVYRRRYGTDLPEASIPSRFLEEVPAGLVEELGGLRREPRVAPATRLWRGPRGRVARVHTIKSPPTMPTKMRTRARAGPVRSNAQPPTSYSGKSYNSIDNIAEFFASRERNSAFPKCRRKSQGQERVSARDRRFVTRNMVKDGLPA